MNRYTYVGLVRGASLELLLAEDASSGTCRLTTTDAGSAPEPLDIAGDDGLVLLVTGIRRDEWIHSATIVERGGALLSIVAQAALGHQPRWPMG